MTTVPATNGRFNGHAAQARRPHLASVADRPAPSRERVDLLSADRDFADAIPAKDHALARVALNLERIVLEPGKWDGPAGLGPDAPPTGLLVVEGLLSHTLMIGGRPSVEFRGTGDFICGEDRAAGLIDEAGWHVHQPTVLAKLDERFLLAGTRWPSLWHVLLRRVTLRADRLASHLAALQLSRVDDRLEAVLWQLADRWGRVTSEGVVVPLTLTHQTLGHLAAAKRPTVSVALGELAESGRVTRLVDGSWLLRHG